MVVGASLADNPAFLFLGNAMFGGCKELEETAAEVFIDLVHADVLQLLLAEILLHLLSHVLATLQGGGLESETVLLILLQVVNQ